MSLLLLFGGGQAVAVFEPYCAQNTELIISGLSNAVTLAGITGSESLAANLASVASVAGVTSSETLAGTVAGSTSECN